MKTFIALTALVLLTACAQTPAKVAGAWDSFAYVDPTVKPNFGTLKSLQSPGMY